MMFSHAGSTDFSAFGVWRAVVITILSLVIFKCSALAQTDDSQTAVQLFNQGQDLHEKGDLTGAVRLYESALKLLPGFPEAEYQRAAANLALGHIDQAEKSFRRAVELRPDWTLPLTGLGSLLVDKGEYIEAEKLLRQAIELDANNPPALGALAEIRLRTNAAKSDLEELLGKINQLASKASPAVSILTAKAALEAALGRPEVAKKSLKAALAAAPASRAALVQMANFALAEGDIEGAREYSARLDKGLADDAWKLLTARVAASEGRLDEAIAHLNSLSRPDASALELLNRIKIYRSASAADLEKLLESAPKDAAMLGRLCTLYRRTDPLKALNYCRTASEVEPNNIAHAVGFGSALVQAKQFDAAVGLLRKLMEIAPENLTVRANLATALFHLKRYPEAKAEFLWLTGAQPKSAGAYLFLGIIHDQLGEYLDALANYQHYLRLADPAANKLDIEKVNFRLPALQKLIKKK